MSTGLSGSHHPWNDESLDVSLSRRAAGSDEISGIPLRPRPPGNLAGDVFVAMAEQEAKSCVTAMHEFVETLESAGSSDLHLVSEVSPRKPTVPPASR